MINFFLIFFSVCLQFWQSETDIIFKWRFNYLPKEICQEAALDSAFNVDFVFECVQDSAYFPINECIFTCKSRNFLKHIRFENYKYLSIEEMVRLMPISVLVVENRNGSRRFLHEMLSEERCNTTKMMLGAYSAYCGDIYYEEKFSKFDTILTHNHLVFPVDSFYAFHFSQQMEITLKGHTYFRGKFKDFEGLKGRRINVNDLKITANDKEIRFHYLVVPSKETKALKPYSKAGGTENFVITSEWLDLEKALNGF